MISPLTNLVSIKEDLDFRMIMGGQAAKNGDCIRFVFNNPYFEDAPDTYKSFDLNEPYAEPCEVRIWADEIVDVDIDLPFFEIVHVFAQRHLLHHRRLDI